MFGYLQRNVSLSNFLELKKMKKSFTRMDVSIWTPIPLAVKLSTYLIFVKKLKSLFLHVLDNEFKIITVES